MSYIQITQTTYDTEYFTNPQMEYANLRKRILNYVHDVLRDYTFDESRIYDEVIVPYSAVLGNVSGYELSISKDWWIESFDNINEMIENISQEDEDVRVTHFGLVDCVAGPRAFVFFDRRNAQYNEVDIIRAMMVHGAILKQSTEETND